MKTLLFVFLGGGLGAVSRYGVYSLFPPFHEGVFPWSTLAVNLAGSFLIGFLFKLFMESAQSAELRGMLMTGFLGAFTTFSTFSLESLRLFRVGNWKYALAYLGISIVLGLLLAAFGMFAGGGLLKVFK